MRLALQAAAAHDGTDAAAARAARKALRRLFRDLGSEIVARGLAGIVRARLDAYGLRLPARIWFAGRCDPSPDLMAHLLWTVQATADAVGAAIDLHARARIDESSDHHLTPEAWR